MKGRGSENCPIDLTEDDIPPKKLKVKKGKDDLVTHKDLKKVKRQLDSVEEKLEHFQRSNELLKEATARQEDLTGFAGKFQQLENRLDAFESCLERLFGVFVNDVSDGRCSGDNEVIEGRNTSLQSEHEQHQMSPSNVLDAPVNLLHEGRNTSLRSEHEQHQMSPSNVLDAPVNLLHEGRNTSLRSEHEQHQMSPSNVLDAPVNLLQVQVSTREKCQSDQPPTNLVLDTSSGVSGEMAPSGNQLPTHNGKDQLNNTHDHVNLLWDQDSSKDRIYSDQVHLPTDTVTNIPAESSDVVVPNGNVFYTDNSRDQLESSQFSGCDLEIFDDLKFGVVENDINTSNSNRENGNASDQLNNVEEEDVKPDVQWVKLPKLPSIKMEVDFLRDDTGRILMFLQSAAKRPTSKTSPPILAVAGTFFNKELHNEYRFKSDRSMKEVKIEAEIKAALFGIEIIKKLYADKLANVCVMIVSSSSHLVPAMKTGKVYPRFYSCSCEFPGCEHSELRWSSDEYLGKSQIDHLPQLMLAMKSLRVHWCTVEQVSHEEKDIVVAYKMAVEGDLNSYVQEFRSEKQSSS